MGKLCAELQQSIITAYLFASFDTLPLNKGEILTVIPASDLNASSPHTPPVGAFPKVILLDQQWARLSDRLLKRCVVIWTS